MKKISRKLEKQKFSRKKFFSTFSSPHLQVGRTPLHLLPLPFPHHRAEEENSVSGVGGERVPSRLEVMFDAAERRADELAASHELLETWKRRGDELLYSMIPRTVADRLRGGASPLSTCEVRRRVCGVFLEFFDFLILSDILKISVFFEKIFSFGFFRFFTFCQFFKNFCFFTIDFVGYFENFGFL